VVQDLPANADSGRRAAAESLPADVASRLTFQAHDFTQPQPMRGGDAYLLRMILHDWPDDEAANILRNMVAAMDKANSRLLIMDPVSPAPGSVPVSVERIVRIRDLTMLQAFNSKERDEDDWKVLLAAADLRLHLVRIIQPLDSAMSVLEVALGLATDEKNSESKPSKLEALPSHSQICAPKRASWVYLGTLFTKLVFEGSEDKSGIASPRKFSHAEDRRTRNITIADPQLRSDMRKLLTFPNCLL